MSNEPELAAGAGPKEPAGDASVHDVLNTGANPIDTIREKSGDSPSTTEPGRPESGSREARSTASGSAKPKGKRDRLAPQLDSMRGREAERLAGNAGLADATDLWRDGLQLDALLAE